MYTKLAITNIKNNRQFYFPYLLTGIITVAMFYIMCALESNPGIQSMPGAKDLGLILRLGIGVIGIFAVIFLFYTNSFIIKRRKKELGIYNILGMEKRHIAKILSKEAFFTAIIAIGGGLVTGVLFHKLACMLLYRMIGFNGGITFSFSKKGVMITAILFAIVYLLTYIYDLFQVQLANPIELLQSGNKGEREPKTKAIMAVLGVLCLGTGYFIAITTKNDQSTDPVFCSSHPCNYRNLSAVYGRKHRFVKNFTPQQRILLSDQAFYIRIGNDLPDETKRSGTCKHLHLIHHGIGSRIDNSQSLCRY